ncbi:MULTISPECIES: SDR family NAD(P)-dependent oxidoreductase [Nocardia]|uniref:SDR family NAD(P)-dependent oxidoreductase n=1 Tax=Nocardia TaxID=1817 RepID=UPI000D6884D6|nr:MULTISPECIES: SDR family oxidoreductase [Nocardia]
MADELSGKVAIVTGGSVGIGRAIVERFHAEGARVVIADTNRERGAEVAEACGTGAIFRCVDVADLEQMAGLITFALDAFGALDVMVNNAGISGTLHRSILHDDLADFTRVMSVNVLGVMAGTQFAARHMAENGGGSIVNMSSIGGIQAGGGVMTYRASKAAVIQYTKSAAIELAQHEIRVNCIAPGNIPTTLLASSAAGMSPEKAERFAAVVRETMRADRPLDREGTPEDVAEAALYLGSERSRYITGTILPIDGGTVAGKPVRRRADSNGKAVSGRA